MLEGPIQRWPRGRFRSFAFLGIRTKSDPNAITDFLPTSSTGAHARPAEVISPGLKLARERIGNLENEAWATAKAAGTVAAYESFLSAWPKSSRSDLLIIMEPRLVSMEPDRPSRRILIRSCAVAGGMIITIVLAIILGSLWRQEAIGGFYLSGVNSYTKADIRAYHPD
jgi:hypothetical protein